jgi:hypothetical protein
VTKKKTKRVNEIKININWSKLVTIIRLCNYEQNVEACFESLETMFKRDKKAHYLGTGI